MAGRAATSSAKWAREFLFRRVSSNPLGATRNCSSVPGASSAPKVPHFSKRVSSFDEFIDKLISFLVYSNHIGILFLKIRSCNSCFDLNMAH